MKLLTFLFSLLCIATLNAQAEPKIDVPKKFADLIPIELKGNLELVEVKNRCENCEPFRFIEYYDNNSNEPIKKEKVFKYIIIFATICLLLTTFLPILLYAF